MSAAEISVPVIRPRRGRRERLRALLRVRAVETARQGMRQLAAHRMRTALALSGIIVGVAAVVGSLTLLDGVEAMVRASFEKLGGTQVGRVSGQNGVFRGGRWIPFQKRYPVTIEDMAALQGALSEIEAFSPNTNGPAAVSAGHNRIDGAWVSGVGVNFLEVRPQTIIAGRFFNATEARGRERVAVLSRQLAVDLFDRGDVAGEEIMIGGQRFVVAGVFQTISRRRRAVLIPLETAVFRLGHPPEEMAAWVKVRSGVSFESQRDGMLEVLARRHPGAKKENFRIFSFGEFQGDALRGVAVQGKILISVALLCLLASGVGILNVFLISVTERTAEIGLRLALGASPRAVRGQFLFESLLLCGIGGAIGILAAQGVAALFAAVVHARAEVQGGLFGDTPLPVGLGLKGIVIGLALAVLTAVIFGSYPAWRASRFDPATSLRHE
jgi:ABC-type antimicrobial peptide transport system permease subunit